MNKDTAARELAIRYAQCMDDRSFDLLDGIMTRDVVMAAPEFECNGLEAFREQVQILHDYSGTMHLIGNQSGAWQGDSYSGETYCVATHIYEKDDAERKWEVGIRYQDEIALTAGAFKYTRRYLNIVWQSDTPLQA